MSKLLPVSVSLSVDLASEDATVRLAERLSVVLRAGDSVLLAGPIGAGKTHLARALIRHRFGPGEDVPSPSFTLVQTYGPPEAEIWHADLYRLSHPDEVRELGLDDAFGSAICLVEWPDRLGHHQPDLALHVTLSIAGGGRLATITGGRAGQLHDLAVALGND